MAFSKIILNGATLIDVTSDTVVADKLYQSYTAHGADGQIVIGTASSGGATINNQTTTVTPTESQQIVTYDSSHTGLSTVTITAIPSTYIGSQVPQKSSNDLTASGDTITAPAGYYAAAASKSVSLGTAGTPTAAKGSVSNHSISVTPSVTNTTGYITGGTKTGTAVSVSASELVSGTLSISSTGTSDVTNYASVSVSIPFVTYYTGSSAPASSLGANGDIYLQTS